MSEAKPEAQKVKVRLVHLPVREDIYLELWNIVKERFPIPSKKFSIVVNEALEEYVRKHREEKGKS
jgi:hypothetical protein